MLRMSHLIRLCTWCHGWKKTFEVAFAEDIQIFDHFVSGDKKESCSSVPSDKLRVRDVSAAWETRVLPTSSQTTFTLHNRVLASVKYMSPCSLVSHVPTVSTVTIGGLFSIASLAWR